MAKFQYVNKGGQLSTFDAADSTAALSSMPGDADPHSGVSVYTAPEVQKLQQMNSPATPTSSVVSSSDKTVNWEKGIMESAAKLSNIPSEITDSVKDASDEALTAIDDFSKKLEERRKAEIESINTGFEDTKRQTEESQKREGGATNVALQRAGGYLGTQISAVGVLNNMAERHRIEMASLQSKKQAAISAANSAIDDKQFQLAQARLQEVKDTEQEVYKRKNDFFNRTMEVIKTQQDEDARELAEQNRQRDDARSLINGIITNFGGVEFDELDPEAQAALEQMSSAAGYPLDLIKGQFKTLKEQKMEADADKTMFSQQMAMANLAIRQASFSLSQARFERGEGGSGEVLTGADLDKYGLPRSLAGRSKTEIEGSFGQKEVPSWYREVYFPFKGIPFKATDEGKVQESWDAFRNSEVKDTDTSTGDFGALYGNLPPVVK